jgi:tetratricopeptide (TPR) repeat protein
MLFGPSQTASENPRENRSMKRVAGIMVFISLAVAALFAEPIAPFSLSLLPSVGFPIGNSASLYTIGGGVDVQGRYVPSAVPFLSLGGGLTYTIAPTLAGTNLSLFGLEAIAGVQYEVLSHLTLSADAAGGYYLGLYGSQTGKGPYVSGRAGVSFRIMDSFDLGISALYRNFLAAPNPLFELAGGAVTLTYRPGAPRGEPKMEIPGMELIPIFPVFYSYYDQHPVGKARIRNNDNGDMENVRVSFFINKFMDLPKASTVIPRLAKGEEVTVDLYALFSDKVLDVTEGTKVASEVKVDYSMGGKQYSKSRVETVQLYDRNASIWDDNRKAAAFVSAKDPVILTFAKNAAGSVRATENKSFTDSFRTALCIFESLTSYGLEYVIDPKSSYADLSKDALAVDFLQFPRQTLEYKGGDCDDISILYAALLESVGIETAFIVVPGHIFMAFAPEIQQSESNRIFTHPEDMIFLGEKCWIPVEITMVKQGFVKAWRAGALTWRSNSGKEGVGFYPVHEAWGTYAPVGLAGGSDKVVYPSEEKLKGIYTAALDRFIDSELAPQEALLKADLAKNPKDPKKMNRLGILYAKYGKMEPALAQFEKLTKKPAYPPALVNAGNAYLLKGDIRKALDFYERAAQQQPDNIAALVGAAKANYELENRGTIKELYAKIKKQDPETASQFAYLISEEKDTTRAASQDSKEKVLWTE